MNWILGKLAGNKVVAALLAVQKFLNGRKSYLAGSILALQGLTCLVEQLCGLEGLSGVLDILKGIHENPCVGKIAEGLGIMGLRSAIAKNGDSK